MGSFIDLSGKKFGRLTVIERDLSRKRSAVYWLCKCECGNIASVKGIYLRDGHTRSCGCLRKETEAKYFLYNNQTKKENPRLYSIWKSMKRRCYDEKHNSYHNYGGRGIRICDAWISEDGFESFVEWALKCGYKSDLTIDRINVDSDYSPENCRWITKKENSNNKRNCRYIEYNNETKTLAQWAEMYGLRQCELKRRLDFLQLPIGLALTMNAKPKTDYNGRMLCINNLAQSNHIKYRDFLIDVFIHGKSANEVICERGKKND